MADLKESRHLKALKDKLREMFQLDQADLDFGIYRIMNQKRDEIERFLEKDLLPQVREALQEYQPADLVETQRKLEKAIEGAKAAGIDPEQAPSVRQLQAELEDSIDISKLEEEVYSHLSTFFSRYYQGGDFLSLRRYKEGVYALPYEGEEVKLHWANADQYYIKSTEAFRSYAFKVPQTIRAEPGMTGSIRERRIRFDLASAGTERDNTKAASGKERRFILDQDVPLEMDGDELVIRFCYRPDEQKRKQKDLNAEAIEALLGLPEGAPATNSVSEWEFWLGALSEKAPTEANANRTVLEKHLANYTARNSFDYFIHKDLGGFLRRELDFFIKNEVMFLDDIESDTAPRVEQYLSKIRVLRKIAHKIIAFLAQLEDFQKKLWLKKKFVLETNWLVTLDKVPEELYEEIAANDAQREEWLRLFGIDEFTTHHLDRTPYSNPLSMNFLKDHPSLVVDTAFFEDNFKETILSSIEDITHDTRGLLVMSENSHALRLLKERFQRSVRCIYIDPPYNTGSDGFIYKDAYQHSSWMSMMADRLSVAKDYLHEQGSIYQSIDDVELYDLKEVTDSVFGKGNFVSNVIWQKNFSPKNSARYFSVDHDYILVHAADKGVWSPTLLPRSQDADDRYTNVDNDPRGPWASSDLTARNYYGEGMYEVTSPNGTKFKPTMGTYWRVSKSNFDALDEDGRIWWGEHGGNMPRQKRFLSEVKQGVVPQTLWKYQDVGHTQDAKREMLSLVTFENTEDVLNTVKPTDLIRRIIHIAGSDAGETWTMDFFAGSGTTAHAVLKKNAEDGDNCKFITVEMGAYAEAVTKQRIVRALYSPSWKDGNPLDVGKRSHVVKYLRLESYEDCLDNISLVRKNDQKRLIDNSPEVREDYMLRYMLDTEASGSLLSMVHFNHPFNYTLSVVRDEERETASVDLVETFNYLLGLRVKTQERKRGVLEVIGVNPEGETTLVLWRDVEKVDNDALDDWFQKQGYNARELEFQLIYVNGDNNIENQRRPDETWKVRLIEEYFHKLMFDVEGV